MTVSHQAPGLIDRLRHRGWRMTAQRRAVAQVLTGTNLHLTADDVFERAGQVLPELSRATVYNTLNELTEMGELRVTSFDGGLTRRYDPNGHEPHHHLVCKRCGEVQDVLADHQVPDLPRRDRRGFDLHDAHIVYEGLCSTCRA